MFVEQAALTLEPVEQRETTSGPSAYRLDEPRLGLAASDVDAVWRLLKAADEDFVPPLSARVSTVQQSLGESASDPRGPGEYFRELQNQWFLLARDVRGEVVGFMSYRRDHLLTNDRQARMAFYVSTVIVGRAFRRHGITRGMYQALIEAANVAEQAVATRTWSTNNAHLFLLAGLGFEVSDRIPDDRGPGLDTLHLSRVPPEPVA